MKYLILCVKYKKEIYNYIKKMYYTFDQKKKNLSDIRHEIKKKKDLYLMSIKKNLDSKHLHN